MVPGLLTLVPAVLSCSRYTMLQKTWSQQDQTAPALSSQNKYYQVKIWIGKGVLVFVRALGGKLCHGVELENLSGSECRDFQALH